MLLPVVANAVVMPVPDMMAVVAMRGPGPGPGRPDPRERRRRKAGGRREMDSRR